MAYEQFAYIYDKLMEDVPYAQWLTWVETIRKEFFPDQSNFSILDVACGTGELSVRFAKKGWNVTGVDLSEDMLAIANEKASDAQVSIPFIMQDMTDLQGFEQQDCAVIFLDSLCYLPSEKEVKQTFQSIYELLKDGGVLLFDVHSTYKMNEIFIDSTFTLVEDDISYIWHSFKGEHEHSVEHELTFFVYDETSSQYDRFEEFHKQRTYSVTDLQKWLTEVGFTVLSVNGDTPNSSIDTKSERIFFTCKK